MENTPTLLYTVLAIVAVIVLLGLVVLVLRWVRRMQLRRTFGTFEGFVATHRAKDIENKPHWVPVIFRYQRDQVEMLKLHSISPIPIHKFRRSALEIQRLDRAPETFTTKLPENYVIVQAEHEPEEYLFSMSFDAYAGLSAWWEARQIMGFGRW